MQAVILAAGDSLILIDRIYKWLYIKNMEINFTTQIWKEGKMYVSYAPELDVSSCGKTPEEAAKNLKEAIEGYLEVAKEKGTLNEILEEAGYIKKKGKIWEAPRIFIGKEIVRV